MKKLLIFTLLLCCTVKALSYTERNYLQKQANVSSLQEVLILNQQWVTYPAYTDRTGWDTFLGSFKNECILRGEKQLNYQWQVVKATDYMEFERSWLSNAQATGKSWKNLLVPTTVPLPTF